MIGRQCKRITTERGRGRKLWRLGWLSLAVLSSSALAASAAHSAQGQPRDQALLKAQQFLRQLAAEKTRLETENAKLAQERQTLSANLDKAKQALDEAQGLLARYQETILGYKQRVEQTETVQRDNIAKYKEALGQSQAALKGVEEKGESLGKALAQKTKDFEQCEQKNLTLYEVNLELLDRYDKKGVLDSLLQVEPVTGLSQVEMENLVQEYRDKIEEAHTGSATAGQPR